MMLDFIGKYPQTLDISLKFAFKVKLRRNNIESDKRKCQMSAIGFLSMFAKITLHYITIHDDVDLENYMTITGYVARS